jgi:hypothetical protein
MDDLVEHPVLAMDSLSVRSAEAVDDAGERVDAMVLTFRGRTVVDGQSLADTESTIAIPADIFVAALLHMHQVAAASGLTPPPPFQRCAAQLLATVEDGMPVSLYRCGRGVHIGRHVDGAGNAWTDEQAEAIWAEFDGE